MRTVIASALIVLVLGTACSAPESTLARSSPSPSPTESPSAVPAVTPTSLPTYPPGPTPSESVRATPDLVVVRYRVERRTGDAATRGFARVLDATLHDRRGWQRAGFRLVRDQRAHFRIVIAEASQVQRLCRPYHVYDKYSCQNGPLVAINADRWRYATPEWTGTLAAYRQMLVNHEVGHLLGMHHPPRPFCSRAGTLALVMSQQSTELGACRPNPWPLAVEIARAARHDLPLAPPYQP